MIFPPAAPAGPILVLRRGEPGNATFERLIAAGTLDRPMADLLRIAARCRLNVLVVGPEGSGKTALLAALARDVSGARRRDLGASSRVSLAAGLEGRIGRALGRSLCAAAGGGRAAAAGPVDRRPGAAGRRAGAGRAFVGGGRGIVAALEPQAMAGMSRIAVDLVVRLGRRRRWIAGRGRDGRCERRADLYPRGRSVSSTDEQRRLLPGACTRQATVRRFRARLAEQLRPAATYRVGSKTRYLHKPISGTNRFEMRGILRVGILIGSSR